MQWGSRLGYCLLAYFILRDRGLLTSLEESGLQLKLSLFNKSLTGVLNAELRKGKRGTGYLVQISNLQSFLFQQITYLLEKWYS